MTYFEGHYWQWSRYVRSTVYIEYGSKYSSFLFKFSFMGGMWWMPSMLEPLDCITTVFSLLACCFNSNTCLRHFSLVSDLQDDVQPAQAGDPQDPSAHSPQCYLRRSLQTTFGQGRQHCWSPLDSQKSRAQGMWLATQHRWLFLWSHDKLKLFICSPKLILATTLSFTLKFGDASCSAAVNVVVPVKSR